MKITTRRIAQSAGVSAASVCRYLNGQEAISQELSDKIQGAMEQLGCENCGKKESKRVILVLLTHLRFSFYSRAVQELLDQEKSKRYTLIILQYDSKSPEAVKSFVNRMKPVGTIYFEEEIDDSILKYLQNSGIRTVMCGGVAVNHDSDMVHVNDMMAAYDGTHYLMNLGHRDILFLSDDIKKIGAGFQRIAGCRKAMEERGLLLAEEKVVCGPVTFEAGYAAMESQLKSAHSFTAVFAFSDELAVGAMAALYDRGLSVPGDVSVLGYDDLCIATKVRPRLSTIHQPVDGFVSRALEIFEQPEQQLSSEILLQYSIVERESCRSILI